MSTTVLLTGFEPFARARVNSSWLAVKRAASLWIGPETLRIAVLPVEFGTAADRLDELIDLHQPEIVVATGLASGRDRVTPERVAINVDDARIPDNAGRAPVDRTIVADGPAAYFSTLPVKAVVEAVSDAGIRAGFVHVPLATEFPGDLGEPTMPMEDIATALTLVVRTSIDVRVDAPIAGGAVS